MIQEIINKSYHDTIEFTPYELHWNKKPNKMWAKWLQRKDKKSEMSHEEKINVAEENMKKKGEKRKKEFNNKNKNQLLILNGGDEVLLKANNISDNEKKEISKFFTKYEGPYVIKKK